jgi:hypothetical protein
MTLTHPRPCCIAGPRLVHQVEAEGLYAVGVRDDHLNLCAAYTEPGHLAIEPGWQIVDRAIISRVLKVCDEPLFCDT